MGCFLGCFGLSSNRKHRKPNRKISSQHQRICSYEPLHSSDPTSLNVSENPEKISNSNLRCGAGEKKEAKPRKRVRFNLNVQSYEPMPRTCEITFCDECIQEEERNAEVPAPEKTSDDSGTKSSYPTNYRYQNCVDSYEEDDETAYGESDLEDEDYYTEDEIDYEDEVEEEEMGLYCGEVISTCAEEMVIGSNRSQYLTQVLNPVQSLAQWKAVKAKPAKVKQQPRKENIEPAEQEQEVAVDASLSNWLASPKDVSSKRYLLERSPIMDITNMENR
ncbi:PREDICTED: uncharacterized protein LOC104801071 [Tarenaya hassleriana]|uniref:uncharacterized protein LOC104801071 n=1 Tax=Tarenaya hassleriana TaxID=28532 RepID=UPI00053CA0F5|nr:PREDICTED: uncharacterized protein LOC104801071 [Tarenaya hassleriana]